MPRVTLLLGLLCVPLIVGCEGCRRDAADDSEQAEEQAPQEDFTSWPPQPLPSSGTAASGATADRPAVKPGHWTTASQVIQSNQVDARGELVHRAGVFSRGSAVGRFASA